MNVPRHNPLCRHRAHCDISSVHGVPTIGGSGVVIGGTDGVIGGMGVVRIDSGGGVGTIGIVVHVPHVRAHTWAMVLLIYYFILSTLTCCTYAIVQ
jgi:hypothetical protein